MLAHRYSLCHVSLESVLKEEALTSNNAPMVGIDLFVVVQNILLIIKYFTLLN